MTEHPTVTLNNGVRIPQLGFGVFQVPDDETAAAVSAALSAGYRSIDTAAAYGNERGVGQAVAESDLPREEIFLTTKLWNPDQGYDATLAAFDASLSKLGTDYLDLYLIHWPVPAGDRYLDTWRALEKVLSDGRVRAIGVSNFLPEHLERVIAEGGTIPAVNQVELHPALQQRELLAFHTKAGIATEAWSPLAQGSVLGSPIIRPIAERVGASPAQVILRWHLDAGRIVIPKSVTPARIAENIDVFGIELTDADRRSIDMLDNNGRIGPHPAEFVG